MFARIAALVYLPAAFAFSQTSSVENVKITAPDAANFDAFGMSVAIDADTAVVGAHYSPAGVQRGAVYVYVRGGTNWVFQKKLTASDGSGGDLFGFSVAIQGDTVLVGALNKAYVYTRSGTNWSERTRLVGSDTAGGDRFGSSVAISGDTFVIGAVADDDPVAGNEAGSAYFFVESGTNWVEQQKISADDKIANGEFGYSVSLDGDFAIVGARYDDDAGAFSGAAYVYVRSTNIWTVQAKVVSDDLAAGDVFGGSVSIDGDIAVIGAYGADVPTDDEGAAYVFMRSGTNWVQSQKLVANERMIDDQFGYSSRLSGNTIVVGSWFDDANGSDAGAAYVFNRVNGIWAQTQRLTASDGASGDQFGNSIGFSANTIWVGAWLDDGFTGAAYVYFQVASNGVPYAWLAEHLTHSTNDYDAATILDSDGDGVWNWEEYWTGTNPTNGTSFLNVESIEYEPPLVRLIWSHDQVDPELLPLTVQKRTNMTEGVWEFASDYYPANGTAIWDEPLTSTNYFYRVVSTNAP